MAYADDSYRSFGRYWCPMCFCLREFIADDVHARDPAKAECEICGYQFGEKTDELHVEGEGDTRRFTSKTEPVLTPEMVSEAQRRRLEEFTQSMLSSGVRKEALRADYPKRSDSD